MLLLQHVQYVPPGSGTLCTGTAVVTGSVPSSGGESGSGSSAGSWSVTGPVWRQVFAIAPEVASSGCLSRQCRILCVCFSCGWYPVFISSAVDGILYSFLQLWMVSCIHFFSCGRYPVFISSKVTPSGMRVRVATHSGCVNLVNVYVELVKVRHS